MNKQPNTYLIKLTKQGILYQPHGSTWWDVLRLKEGESLQQHFPGSTFLFVDQNGQPRSYKIQINEYQRKLIERALEYYATSMKAYLTAQPGEYYDTMLEEVTSLKGMLTDTPAEELKDPGIIHSLCL